MIKAELELMQGEREESGFDLDKVRNLLELCTGQLNTQLLKSKIMPSLDSLYHALAFSGIVF